MQQSRQQMHTENISSENSQESVKIKIHNKYRESAIDRFSVLFCRIILYMNLKISVDFKNNLTSFYKNIE